MRGGKGPGWPRSDTWAMVVGIDAQCWSSFTWQQCRGSVGGEAGGGDWVIDRKAQVKGDLEDTGRGPLEGKCSQGTV